MNCPMFYFLILSILNCISILLYFIMTFPKTFILIEFYLLFICLIYWFYMFSVELNNSSESEIQANFVNDKNTNFLADIVFKYLFIILLSYGFCYLFIYIYDKDAVNIYDKYSFDLNETEKFILKICKWYNKVIIPIALIIDLCFRKRNRVVNPFFDFLILIISAIGLCIYEIICYKFYDYGTDKKIRLILITLISKFILFFFSYLFYDYYMYKVNKIPGSYILCDNSNDPRLIVQE